MKYTAHCKCGKCKLVVETTADLTKLLPRQCDCDSCRSMSSPAALISDPDMNISISRKECTLDTRTNGSQQAFFLHCASCHQLLIVGAHIEGRDMGAVNAFLFEDINFGEIVSIRPYLLSGTEKIKRWADIWGNLRM